MSCLREVRINDDREPWTPREDTSIHPFADTEQAVKHLSFRSAENVERRLCFLHSRATF